MAPGTVVQEPVQAAVWYALNNYNHEDAVFLAERLHAEVGSLESVFLLATCYFRSGRVQQARHLLGQHRGTNNAKCDLLYARCCLQLNDLKSGLLALQGLLCLGESSEKDMAQHFGEDVGVAFWLLGEFNRLLHQTKEAIRHFRNALKYNPFLWTAYQALCELGEHVAPEQCFTVSEYPPFLAHSAPYGCFSRFSSSASFSNETKPLLLASGLETNSKRPSAFTPVDSSKSGYITPDLFGNPTLGKAVASSTPAGRTLQFTASDLRGAGYKAGRLQYEGSVASLQGGPPVSRVQFGSVKAVLDFGSGRQTDDGRRTNMGGSPFTPSFGVLQFTTPRGPAHPLLSSQHTLNFSTITPSPTPLPAAHLKLLQSAPKAAGKRVMFQDTSCVFSLRSPIPVVMETPGSVEEGGLNHMPPTPAQNNVTTVTSTTSPSELTNQVAPLLSRDSRTPPPPPHGVDSPSIPQPRMLSKSAAPLRRSARLSGIGKPTSSARRLSDLVIHNTRAKSRLKSPTRRNVETAGKKVAKVTFTTPLASRKVAQGHAYPATLSPLSHHNSVANDVCNVDTPKENEVLADGDGGKVATSSSVELLTQQTVEQAMMTNIASLMHLLQQVGSAYQALCQYNLVKAIRQFRSLPPNQHHTPWVLGQVARAYFVGEKFKECARLYREVHTMDPHRQEGMELYASALWHLQQEVELSVLAESLHSSAPLRPEGLSAMASVMNLAKDHESAVKFLQRAIKVCPSFTYAHTLLGHEHWVTKNYDKALSSFQAALTLDPRHYNAWYGMAHVYYAQEKYKFAETYASRALNINGCSSIACTQVALAQFHQNKLDLALVSLDRATAINSSNPIPRFHRARVLESLGRLEDALLQLEELTSSWPKEPNLYIAKGKILKKMNRLHEAVLQFSWALDFSRSGASRHIREEVDQAYNLQDTLTGDDDSYFVPHYDSEEEEEEEEEGEEEEGIDDSMQS